MLDQLESLYEKSLAGLETVDSTAVLETWYRDTLGKKGGIYLLTRQVGQLSADERPIFGKRINVVKSELEAAYEARLAELKAAELADKIASSAIDVTLPGRPLTSGGLHVITQTLRDIYRIFGDMGFQVYRTRDVETDAMNFELLNFPPHHPAREMQDLDLALRHATRPLRRRQKRFRIPKSAPASP